MNSVEYFYPKGFWGGYNQWFEPCIPGRIGDLLISSVRKALQGDRKHLLSALFILQSTHRKMVSHIKGVKPFEVLCHPTEEGKRAAQILSEQ